MVGKRTGRDLYRLSFTPERQTESQPKSSALFVTPALPKAELWHQRLAYVSYQTLFNMASNNLVEGLSLSADRHSPSSLCLGCVAGKAHRLSFPTGRTRANQVGQLIHSDVCGPVNIVTPGGARYYIVFVDDFSS